MWILGLKGLIWKRLFRALDKVSLLLKINLLIKLVLWSFFWSKKGVANHLGTSGGGGGRLMGMCRWMGSHFHDWVD